MERYFTMSKKDYPVFSECLECGAFRGIVPQDHKTLHAGDKKKCLRHKKDCPTKNKKTQSAVITKKTKKKRKSINPTLRKKVWDTYIGQKTSSKCFCCRKRDITPFTYCNTFQAGHIHSHANGGKASIGNLLPICRDCNMNMSEENWDEYVSRHPHLPIRTQGANISKNVIKATTVIQSLGRMWLERKNPDSHWRQEWLRRCAQ